MASRHSTYVSVVSPDPVHRLITNFESDSDYHPLFIYRLKILVHSHLKNYDTQRHRWCLCQGISLRRDENRDSGCLRVGAPRCSMAAGGGGVHGLSECLDFTEMSTSSVN